MKRKTATSRSHKAVAASREKQIEREIEREFSPMEQTLLKQVREMRAERTGDPKELRVRTAGS